MVSRESLEKEIHAWVVSDTAQQPILLISHSAKLQEDMSAFARQLLPRTSPDAIEIVGEKNRIRVKDIAALKTTLANRSDKRVICIPHAEYLLPEAANALLKTLEEPSKNTRFLLGTKSKRSVLPTIRSRCKVISVHSLIEEMTAFSSADMLKKLSNLRPAEPFEEAELTEISRLVHQMTLERGASVALFKVSAKLRDYYKTASFPGGNTKLAADILLASLANLRNTSK